MTITTMITEEVSENTLRQRIRRVALREELIPTLRQGKWWFSDDRRMLRSPESGLDDIEAWEFLHQQ